MSLKASVGPFDSACSAMPGSRAFSGVISRVPNDLGRVGLVDQALQVERGMSSMKSDSTSNAELVIRQLAPGRERAGSPRAGTRPAGRGPPSGARPSSRISQKLRSVAVAAGADVLHRAVLN
jgi:hypothetical protein